MAFNMKFIKQNLLSFVDNPRIFKNHPTPPNFRRWGDIFYINKEGEISKFK